MTLPPGWSPMQTNPLGASEDECPMAKRPTTGHGGGA